MPIKFLIHFYVLLSLENVPMFYPSDVLNGFYPQHLSCTKHVLYIFVERHFQQILIPQCMITTQLKAILSRVVLLSWIWTASFCSVVKRYKTSVMIRRSNHQHSVWLREQYLPIVKAHSDSCQARKLILDAICCLFHYKKCIEQYLPIVKHILTLVKHESWYSTQYAVFFTTKNA